VQISVGHSTKEGGGEKKKREKEKKVEKKMKRREGLLRTSMGRNNTTECGGMGGKNVPGMDDH